MSTTAADLDKSGRTIQDMFGAVAPRYDLLNHLLSGALDFVWRRRSAAAIDTSTALPVLDLCCGTGDQALALRRRGARVVAADFCVPMLAIAGRKYRRLAARRPAGLAGDALTLPFTSATFGGVTVSFGLRNVADLDAALVEIHRVLASGATLSLLEFAIPRRKLVRGAYLFYFRHLLPRIGALLSPRGSAYTYLPNSVEEFPQREAFVEHLEAAGFVDCAWRDLAAGAVAHYTGKEAVTRVLDGKAMAREIRREVTAGVAALVAAGGRRPGLAALLVGDDPASSVYVGSKSKASTRAGFLSETHKLPGDASPEAILERLADLNGRDEIDGIIVQLPLPAGLPVERILEAVAPDKDVDGIHPVNVGRLWLDREGPAPATPAGIVQMLRRSGIETAGKRAVIVGRSDLVGKPLASLLLREQCTVTVCHSRTRDLPAVTREAEILVAAIGRPAMIGPQHVRDGAVVIDVGINRVSDAATVERLFPGDEQRREQLAAKGAVLVGDVDYAAVAERTSAITPVPGGVGPLTVAMLLVNTLEAARRRQGAGAGAP